MLKHYWYYAYVGYNGYNFNFGAGVQHNRGRFKVSLVEQSLKKYYDYVVVLSAVKITKSEADRILKEEVNENE